MSWDFVRDNWDTINEGGFNMGRLVTSVTNHFSTQIRLDEVKTFFEANPPRGGEMSVQVSDEMSFLSLYFLPLFFLDSLFTFCLF
jgi:hypothetical protein